jgi:hypothetical protein
MVIILVVATMFILMWIALCWIVLQ